MKANIYTYKGETKTLPEFSKQYGIKYTALKERIRKGWDMDRAMNEPVKPRHRREKKQVVCPPTCEECPYPDCIR